MPKTKNAKHFMENLLGEPMSFAKLLRSIRTRDDLTQKELADILEVTVSHISDIENGRKFVSVERAYEFAQKLKDSEKFFVAVALQDQVNQADLDFKVEIA
jgi:transcriptional regulator with XRE-family HTH domain